MSALASFLMSRFGIGSALASIIAWLVLILVASGAVRGGYQFIKYQGADEVRRAVERQNNEAGIKGGEARLSRADCNAGGGVYDFRTGFCSWPSSVDR